MAKVIQFTGLSGAGKTTIAKALANQLAKKDLKVLIVDGDEFRTRHSSDLGFSNEDRLENIKRMADFVNKAKAKYDLIIISAINPFHETRSILTNECGAELVYIKCSLATLVERDTKGLYRRALLPSNDPDHLGTLTGVTQHFDEPTQASLTLDTSLLTLALAVKNFTQHYSYIFSKNNEL